MGVQMLVEAKDECSKRSDIPKLGCVYKAFVQQQHSKMESAARYETGETSSQCHCCETLYKVVSWSIAAGEVPPGDHVARGQLVFVLGPVEFQVQRRHSTVLQLVMKSYRVGQRCCESK